MRRLAVACVALLLAGSTPLAAATDPASRGEVDPGEAEYAQLQRWRYSPAVKLPTAGFAWSRDTASWEMASGRVRLAEPTADGAVLGLVFEGKGTFRMTVPDRFELRQLRRFAGEPELQRIEVEFDKMVLRTSDAALLASLASGARGPYRTSSLARKRQERWLRGQHGDVDARIVAARRSPGEEVARIEMASDRYGWLTWDLDSSRHEEIELRRYNAAFTQVESWLSLDRRQDRTAEGRPGARGAAAFDVEHVEIEARLLELGRDPGASETQRVTFNGDFRAVLDLAVLRPAQRAVLLALHPMAEVTGVFDRQGAALPFLRDPSGRRFASVDNRVHSSELVVLLPGEAPAEKGLRLTVEYRLQVRNYLPGRWWYPLVGPVSPELLDPHTGALEVAIRDSYQVRAMGEGGTDRLAEGVRTNRWRVVEPVKMLTFAFARRMVEERVSRPGVPEVIVFSPPLGSATRQRLRIIGEEVAEALAFYSELLDAPLDVPRLHVTMIQALHGQAFDGLLQLAEESAFRRRTGPSERFQAHEAAHLWWGHRVGWASYRDQWLSEGLSNYLALMYLEARHERGRQLYDEVIEVYTDQILGSIGSSLSPFSRPGMALANLRAEDRIGPIAHGVRAAVGEAPQAYRSQSYDTAVLVLHSVRTLMRIDTGDDAAFIAALRDLVRSHDGGDVSTDDFVAALSRHAAGDWRRFVDQWIRSAAIPRWRWRLRAPAAAVTARGAYRGTISVEQSGVGEEFRSRVPVRVEYADGGQEDLLIEVAGPSTEVALELASAPSKVELNPDLALLARVKSR